MKRQMIDVIWKDLNGCPFQLLYVKMQKYRFLLSISHLIIAVFIS